MLRLVFLIVSMLLLTSCSGISDVEQKALEEVYSLEEYEGASVLYWGNEEIYFYCIDSSNEYTNAKMVVYKYDLQSDRVLALGQIDNYYMSTQSVIMKEDTLLFGVSVRKEDKIENRLYTCNDSLKQLYSWETRIPIFYLVDIIDNRLVIFSPDKSSERYIYNIFSVCLETEEVFLIKSTSYRINGNDAEVMSTADGYEDMIYSYHGIVKNGVDHYVIKEHDIKGDLLQEYEIDIRDFLFLEIEQRYDTVYKMIAVGDIFVLQTLNNRIIVLQKNASGVISLEIPECLSNYPEGYKIVGVTQTPTMSLFFADMFNSHLIKYDVEEGTMWDYNIPMSEKEDGFIASIFVDEEGDILLQTNDTVYVRRDIEYRWMYSVDYAEESTNLENENNRQENDAMPDTEFSYIEKNYYRYDERYVLFSDMPQGIAENIVCYDKLYTIRGNYNKGMDQFMYYPEEEVSGASGPEDDIGGSIFQWLVVNQVQEMDFEDLKNCPAYTELFRPLHTKLGSQMEMDDYVRTILERGCVVVSIDYTDKYTAEVEQVLLQSDDGHHVEYWLLVPEEDGSLKVFVTTQYYLLFAIYHEENIPKVLVIE